MTTSATPKLAGFAVALALLLGGGALAGGLLNPSPPNRAAAGAAHEQNGMGMTETEMTPRGLAVAENGLRLEVAKTRFEVGTTQQLRYAIVDERGQRVRDFDIEHTKRMHLIVVRRDLTAFQHLHPVQTADGYWTTSLTLSDAGSYRVFADFSHDGKKTTLADDLTVDGQFDAQPLPDPASTTTTDDGYTVQLAAGTLRAGEESALRFTVLQDGRRIQVEPYLGANGHLVALRQGDLAFLHVHPTAEQGDQAITFDATFPTPANYRLFLQFKADGVVHTAAFTQVVR